MKKEKLKKHILIILISFSIFIAVSVGLISMVNFYLTKLDIIEHNQNKFYTKLNQKMDKFLLKFIKFPLYKT